MTIRIGAFHHAELNLNGDLQNLLVLTKRLNARGFPCEVVELNGSTFEKELAHGLDFAFIGHGSEAAWASIDAADANFESALLAVADAGVPLLGVSSGFERMIRVGLTDFELKRVDRRSEFAPFDWNGTEIIGYVNSELDVPLFYQKGNIYGTLFHGPLLAKNPDLADYFCKLATNSADEFDASNGEQKLSELDNLAVSARAVARGMFS
jgi:CobQ-like glutamine amidotransferase family enzyme